MRKSPVWSSGRCAPPGFAATLRQHIDRALRGKAGSFEARVDGDLLDEDARDLAFTCLQAGKYWPTLCDAIDRPDLKFTPYLPRFPERIRDYNGDIFAAIKAKDLLGRSGYEVEDHHLTTREATDAFKAAHAVQRIGVNQRADARGRVIGRADPQTA